IQTLEDFFWINTCVFYGLNQANCDAGGDLGSQAHEIRSRSLPMKFYLSIDCRKMSRKTFPKSLSASWEGKMDFQVKLFNWQDQGNHLIVLARGVVDTEAFGLLFDEIEAATEHLSQCKVLVDLSDSAYQVECAQVQGLIARLPLARLP